MLARNAFTGVTSDQAGPSDHQLVAAVRRGDERAFECLYGRYRRRIQAYVAGMCKDHARAEDITQEVFVSALRRMRETERPIAFKPWIYEIAKNACIDQHRRASRAEEVSLEAEGALAPADYVRLVGPEPTPDVAVAAKQELEDLCGAFGGLSETHHDILVMRELEGLSYREIGSRLNMTRPAVESTLFRARKRLSEEYEDLVSGQRCLRVQAIIGAAGEVSARVGSRDTRRLARHIAHCQPCRREAIAAGLDIAALVPPRRSVAARVAALLPFPWVARRGRGVTGADGPGDGWVLQLGALSDHVGPGWAKAATAAAVLLAGAGAGVKATTGGGHPVAPGAGRAHTVGAPGGGGGAAAAAPVRVTRVAGTVAAGRSGGVAAGIGRAAPRATTPAKDSAAGAGAGAGPAGATTGPIAATGAGQTAGRGGGHALPGGGTTRSAVQRTASSAAGAVGGAVTGAVSGVAAGAEGAATVAAGAVSDSAAALDGAAVRLGDAVAPITP
jgi:RNA polymerase sigma factor (sigma-70 family)